MGLMGYSESELRKTLQDAKAADDANKEAAALAYKNDPWTNYIPYGMDYNTMSTYFGGEKLNDIYGRYYASGRGTPFDAFMTKEQIAALTPEQIDAFKSWGSMGYSGGPRDTSKQFDMYGFGNIAKPDDKTLASIINNPKAQGQIIGFEGGQPIYAGRFINALTSGVSASVDPDGTIKYYYIPQNTTEGAWDRFRSNLGHFNVLPLVADIFTGGLTLPYHAIEKANNTEGEWYEKLFAGADRFLDSGGLVDYGLRTVGELIPEGIRPYMTEAGGAIGMAVGSYIPVIGTAAGGAIGAGIGSKLEGESYAKGMITSGSYMMPYATAYLGNAASGLLSGLDTFGNSMALAGGGTGVPVSAATQAISGTALAGTTDATLNGLDSYVMGGASSGGYPTTQQIFDTATGEFITVPTNSEAFTNYVINNGYLTMDESGMWNGSPTSPDNYVGNFYNTDEYPKFTTNEPSSSIDYKKAIKDITKKLLSSGGKAKQVAVGTGIAGAGNASDTSSLLANQITNATYPQAQATSQVPLAGYTQFDRALTPYNLRKKKKLIEDELYPYIA